MKKNTKYLLWGIAAIVLSGTLAKFCGGMGEYPTTFEFWSLFMSIATGICGFVAVLASFE